MSDDNFGPWIDWAGGPCPIPDGTPHEVRRHGDKTTTYDEHPETWSWEQGKNGLRTGDIIAYRVRLPADDLLRQAIEALRGLIDNYVSNVDTTRTAGFYQDPETEDCVIEARAVLTAYDKREPRASPQPSATRSQIDE